MTFINSIERHRRFQMIISAGTVSCAALYFLWPNHGELTVIGGTLTNMIWIWE